MGNENQERVLGLAELAGMIEDVISGAFNRGFWIKAEMARLNLYPESGHCYPDLVEKEGKTVKAQMRGTIWAGTYQRISKQFREVAREPLKDGLQILFFASVRFHPQYGLSLQINDIDPAYTLGQMAREKAATILRLREEGLFDQNRALPYPVLPKRIAVISVSTSKGYSDFMNILESHKEKYVILTTLFPALLQGDKAIVSLLGQLRTIRRNSSLFDAVAIIRGGGGDVGLSCYDDYQLAKEVATFPLPVITGIGHSTNETVVEMVAARNKITPTDVAYSVVEPFELWAERIEDLGIRISHFTLETLANHKDHLHELAGKLQDITLEQMEFQRRKLKDMVRGTLQQTRLLLRTEKENLATIGAVLRLGPKKVISGGKDHLENRKRWLSTTLSTFLQREKDRLKLSESQVQLLDPVNTLKRGFSITYLNGKPVKDSAEVQAGDTITSQLFKGKVTSIIKSNEEK